MRGVWLERLTWPEAGEKIAAGWPFVIPIGAISKEHGHHLPLNTDFLYAKALAEGVMAELPVVIAPILTFGYYPAFVNYPGSLHYSAATFEALLTETFAKLVKDGAKRIAVINTGVSTEPCLRIAVRDFYAQSGIRVITADIRDLGRKSRALLGQRAGGHADESETSVMLAIAPELVRLDRAVADYGHPAQAPGSVFYTPTAFSGDPASGPDYSARGARGDPTLATAEKGRAILADMVGELVSGLRAEFAEAFAALEARR